MNKKKNIPLLLLATLALWLYAPFAQAFLVGSLSTGIIEPAKETHLFFVGYGHEMGTQFLESALTTARKLKENFPERQYVIVQERDKNIPAELETFKLFGINLLAENTKHLDGEAAVKFAKGFTKLASIEIFSHGHSFLGAALSGTEEEQRFYQGTPGIATLKGHFTKNAYLLLHGCNAGFISAPKMSKLLEIPVAGHLTGSNFQIPYTDHHWYFNDKGLFPEKEKPIWVNELSYPKRLICEEGNCSRLVADGHTYNGDYGVHKVGLGFRKFFCNYKHGDECYAAMATALLGFPGEKFASLESSLEDQLFLAKDLLCPIDPMRVEREACVKAVDDAAKSGKMELKFFAGDEPECDLSGCKIQADCKNKDCIITAKPPTPIARNCQRNKCSDQELKQEDPAKVPTNLMTEYSYYLKGLNLLRAELFAKKAVIQPASESASALAPIPSASSTQPQATDPIASQKLDLPAVSSKIEKTPSQGVPNS